MVSMASIQNGLARYIDNDFLPHLTGVSKVLVGAYSGLALKNIGDLFNAYKNHPLVSVLHIVDTDGNVNIEAIYEELAKRIPEGTKVPINIPMVGVYHMDREDLEKIYRYIKS